MTLPGTPYAQNFATAVPGQIADNTPVREILSRTVLVADAPIAAGLGVVRSSTDSTVRLPASSGDVTGHFQGVAIFDPSKPPGAYGAAIFNGSVLPEAIPVLNRGHIYVTVEVDVAQDDPAYLRHTAGGGFTPGMWRNDADTANAAAVTGGKFLYAASAGTVAVLALR